MNIKDFYEIKYNNRLKRHKNWKSLLKVGTKIRMTCAHTSSIAGLEILYKGYWEEVWCAV